MGTVRSRMVAAVALAGLAALAAACGDGAPAAVVDDRAPNPSAGCEADPPRAVAGEHERVELAVDGSERAYLRYQPSGIDGPLPLVVDLHGYGGLAAQHALFTGLADEAEHEGFAVLTPQAEGSIPSWRFRAGDADADLALVAAMIEQAEADLCIDTRRVYVGGLSNGGFLASRVACEMADTVTAVAAVAGIRFDEPCEPSRPIAVLAIHGTADPVVEFDPAAPPTPPPGAPPQRPLGAIIRGYVPQAVMASMARWAEVGRCDDEPVTETVSLEVTAVHWEGCDGVAVRLLRVDGGGHTWPGSSPLGDLEHLTGHATDDIDAAAELWEFFEDQRLPQPP